MSHTPGPWETDDHASHWSIMTADGGQHIADVRQYNAGLTKIPEGDANARLIAAAPDLLAACVSVMDYLSNGAAVHPGSLVQAEVFNAIAKATGK